MRRILLVEDNELNRDMLGRRLMHRGYEVILAPMAGRASRWPAASSRTWC